MGWGVLSHLKKQGKNRAQTKHDSAAHHPSLRTYPIASPADSEELLHHHFSDHLIQYPRIFISTKSGHPKSVQTSRRAVKATATKLDQRHHEESQNTHEIASPLLTEHRVRYRLSLSERKGVIITPATSEKKACIAATSTVTNSKRNMFHTWLHTSRSQMSPSHIRRLSKPGVPENKHARVHGHPKQLRVQ